MAAAPLFSLDRTRYDETTYFGRVKANFVRADVRKMFLGQKDLDADNAKIESWKKGEGKYTDAELWKARSEIESMLHPQSGKIITYVGRMSWFVPANIPIQMGMLLAAPTVTNVILWQWVNQSYNATFNYSNRNTTTASNNSDIMKAYGSATAVSVSVALAGNQLVKRMGGAGILGKCIPWIAVATAGAANVFLMRFKETRTGISIFDKSGETLGTSKAAGKKAVNLTAITRVLLPTPVLLLPPFLIDGLKAMGMMPAGKAAAMAVNVTVCTLCLWGALPLAIAAFTSQQPLDVSKLEPEVQAALKEKGYKESKVYFDRGV